MSLLRADESLWYLSAVTVESITSETRNQKGNSMNHESLGILCSPSVFDEPRELTVPSDQTP